MASRRAESGAAVVEMAFMAVLLVLLVSGVVDLGRAVYTRIAVQEAAQEGAMFGAYEPSSAVAISQRAVESVGFPQLTEDDVTVSGCDDGRLEVTVSHDVQLITPGLSQVAGGALTVAQSFTTDVFGECEAA